MASKTPLPTRQRYLSFTSHLRQMFGCKVHKVSIDAGFTCPNRDGSVAVGGCIYCNNTSFSPTNRRLSVREQIEQGKQILTPTLRRSTIYCLFPGLYQYLWRRSIS